MSRRHKLGITLGIVLAVTVAVSAVGVGWLWASMRGLDELLEHGWLGPPDKRQRVELADHGFAISFAGDWVVEMDPVRLAVDGSDIDTVLAAAPENHLPSCRVGMVPDGASFDAESFVLAWATDRTEGDEYGTSSGRSLPEGVVDVGVREADGTLNVAFLVPIEDDALMVSCEVDVGHDRPGSDDDVFTSDTQAMLLWGMPSIVRSIEPLPAASRGPTDESLGAGHRVKAPSGRALTLPAGWTRLQPEPDDREEALPGFLQQLWPWRVSLNVAVIGPQPVEGDDPVETCMLGEIMLADYMRSWDEASLESIVALVAPIVAPGDTLGGEFEPGSATYLNHPTGRVARLDFSGSGAFRSVYVLPQQKALHLLVCEGPDKEVDVWDSLARSIEVTPLPAN